MTIIEIAPLDNWAHRNQTGGKIPVPEGWAILPSGLDTPNFPFGTLTVDDSTPPIVTGWTAGELPEPEPEPEPEQTVWDELDAAYREGVNGV